MLTTVIGAYPKPDYIKITDWFNAAGGTDTAYPTKFYEDEINKIGENIEDIFEKATKEIIKDQEECGIDILTDGEVRRENYIHYHCRHLDGIDFENLTEKFIILSSQKNIKFKTNCTLIKIPTSTNLIKNTIENFIQSLKIQFHDISINNERLTNIKNDSFCYLTKLESEILSHLILEKESTKNYIKENILQIKSTIQTNSLDSHLTRIRKKMNKINTSVKIQSKSEKLLICT